MQTREARKTAAIESLKTMSEVEECVVKELLRMGASYNRIGTYYIQDCIIAAVNSNIRDFKNLSDYVNTIKTKVAKKYGITKPNLWKNIERTIDRMLYKGDYDYILSIFKGDYDPDRQTVAANPFILTVAEKVRADMAKQYRNADYFRNKIKESVENITDPTLLNGICNILMSLKGGATLWKNNASIDDI